MPVAGQLTLQREPIRGMVGESNLLGQLAEAASVYREQPIRTGSH